MPPLQSGSLLGGLVFNHLVHQGYWHTAAAVAQDALAGAKQVSEQDRQVQMTVFCFRYEFACLLQACPLLPGKFGSLRCLLCLYIATQHGAAAAGKC